MTKEGDVLVRNPYNERQVTRYRLAPDVVELIAFCTKNPAPMLPYIKEFIKIAGKSGMTIRPCAEGDVIHEAKQESWIDHQ